MATPLPNEDNFDEMELEKRKNIYKQEFEETCPDEQRMGAFFNFKQIPGDNTEYVKKLQNDYIEWVTDFNLAQSTGYKAREIYTDELTYDYKIFIQLKQRVQDEKKLEERLKNLKVDDKNGRESTGKQLKEMQKDNWEFAISIDKENQYINYFIDKTRFDYNRWSAQWTL